jgi:uncharacterized protein (TIGR01777 family)
LHYVVTGGTGFIGTKLIPLLRAQGHEVTAFSRRERAPENGVRFVKWTPEADGPWMDVIDGADVVINLAGTPVFDERWTPERKKELFASRLDSTTRVSAAIARAKKKPSVLISASAVGIYGMHLDDKVLDESSPLGDDVLAQICTQWEAAADGAREAGVRVVHPRIGIVLGPDGGALKSMLTPFRAFVGGPVGSGKQWMSWIHLADAVRALVFPVACTELVGPYNLTAPTPVTMNEMAQAIGEVLHRPSAMRVPEFAARLAFGERAAIVLTGQRVVPRRLEALGFAFEHPVLKPALENLLGPA